jgi:hypothetical protein
MRKHAARLGAAHPGAVLACSKRHLIARTLHAYLNTAIRRGRQPDRMDSTRTADDSRTACLQSSHRKHAEDCRPHDARLARCADAPRDDMTDSTCRVCAGAGWVCEEHGSHAVSACPSSLILGKPCTCNPAEDPPPEFEIINAYLVREDHPLSSH